MSVRAASLRVPAFERIAHPTTTVDGRRAPALRFGDPRVQALAGALAVSLHAVTGITNKSLRALMTGLLGERNYGMNRASYDLTRLRRNGLIVRIEGRNRYRLTDDGRCRGCGTSVPGRYDGPVGRWGRRRMPVRVGLPVVRPAAR